MATQMQAVAVVLLLAALAYLLYVWSRRHDRIECPSCGARVDMYEDECPHCGHEKGADVDAGDEAAADEDAAADTAGAAVETAGEVHIDADRTSHLGEDEVATGPDAAATGPGDGPDGGPEPDFEQLVADHTVDQVKERVEEDGLDPAAVLEAEQANKDRVTLTRWLEDRIDE